MTLHKKFSFSELSAPYFLVFSPNPRKYGPETLRIRILFIQCGIYQGSCHTSQERPLCKDYASTLSNCFQRAAQELLNAGSAWKGLIIILKSAPLLRVLVIYWFFINIPGKNWGQMSLQLLLGKGFLLLRNIKFHATLHSLS